MSVYVKSMKQNNREVLEGEDSKIQISGLYMLLGCCGVEFFQEKFEYKQLLFLVKSQVQFLKSNKTL